MHYRDLNEATSSLMRRGASAATTLIAALALSGCMGSGRPQSISQLPLIQYKMPEAKLHAQVTITLLGCQGSDVLGTMSAKLVGTPEASAKSYTLYAADLTSARMSQDLTIELNDNGTLSTVNSAASDKTGAIFGNVLSTALSILPFLRPADSRVENPLPCGETGLNSHTVQSLGRFETLSLQIADLRRQTSSDPAVVKVTNEALDGLYKERAALVSGPLQVSIKAPLKLYVPDAEELQSAEGLLRNAQDSPCSEPTAGRVDCGEVDFSAAASKFFTSNTELPKGELKLSFSGAGTGGFVGKTLPKASPGIQLAEVAKFPLKLTVEQSFFKSANGNDLTAQSSGSFLMPQWGREYSLPLKVKIGRDRTIGLTLDDYGRVKKLHWVSNATLENLTGTVSSTASSVTGYLSANSNIAEQKAEIDALETQQKLNRLRACQEILEAEGWICDDGGETE